ncbi:hypothetical protein [Ornithinimicrobium pekingense]|uniref:Uncharacterized protein n=1 Tax=Ornithinimicrobium pekingense TaxID=384677 RepID=A0ABQ2FBU6_9MICO|nr:hypothetical protein [Ornithinimicrobium pekingense]GGK73602.1 hypothetical protein GCM10011509_22770 [Ornithinimicrobium pekingense]
MRAQKLLLAGAGASGVLTVVAVVAAVLHWWWLVVLAGMLLVSAALLVALDADRRVRELRTFVRAQVAAIDTTGGRAAPSTEDVVGTVRVLQAQYTGRLDRLQDTVEQALRRRDDRG